MSQLAQGTPIEGSSDPKTREQNNTLQLLANSDGQTGSQYAGSLLFPDGTLSRDTSVLNIPPARATEIASVLAAAGKLNSDGVTRSGGYILILGMDGTPIQYVGCAAGQEQTKAERLQAEAYAASSATGSVADGMRHGMSRSAAAALAAAGAAIGSESSASAKPVPVEQVIGNGSGVSKVVPFGPPAAQFGNAVIAEDFTLRPDTVRDNVAVKSTSIQPTMISASVDTAATLRTNEMAAAKKEKDAKAFKYGAAALIALAVLFAARSK
jgi:hypothetical protein